jgi:hypothetical protein
MFDKSPNIPLELYRSIILHLDQDRPSLLAVSLASRALNVEGQRVLYKTMNISKDAENVHTLFLTTIISQKRLAFLVEEYRQPYDLLQLQPQKGPLWKLVHHGLQAMVNLKRLFLNPSRRHPSVEILRGCTFQLDFLQWYNAVEEADPLEFLASQVRLRALSVLQWNKTSTSIPIPPTMCPRLEIPRGDRGAIEAFLPERRVVSLRWMPGIDERFDSIITLSRSFKEIKFLSLGGLQY